LLIADRHSHYYSIRMGQVWYRGREVLLVLPLGFYLTEAFQIQTHMNKIFCNKKH